MEKIEVIKHLEPEKKGGIEYFINNYDYFDGNKLIANTMVDEFEFEIINDIDGMFFTEIILKDKNDDIYHLVWHEDLEAYAYCDSENSDVQEKFYNLLCQITNRIKPITPEKLDEKTPAKKFIKNY